jgi:hypothetical protein
MGWLAKEGELERTHRAGQCAPELNLDGLDAHRGQKQEWGSITTSTPL